MAKIDELSEEAVALFEAREYESEKEKQHGAQAGRGDLPHDRGG